MDLKGWLKIVEFVVPIVLGSTKLAPLAPYVQYGIQAAEGIPGASGADKLKIATQIVNIGVAAANAQAGKPIIDPASADTLVTSGINAVVAATNLKAKQPVASN